MINTSPKRQFLKTRDSKIHADLVVTETFKNAINYALLEFIHQNPSTKDQYQDACACNRITGARQFIDVLMNLSEPFQSRQVQPKANLDHII